MTATPMELEFDVGNVVQLRRHMHELGAEKAEPFLTSTNQVLDLWNLSDMAIVESGDYLLKGVILERGFTMIHGDSQAGKSLHALHIAATLATSKPEADWWGQERIGGPHKVIYMAGEGQSGIFERLAGIQDLVGGKMSDLEENLKIVRQAVPLNPATSAGGEAIIELVTRWQPDVIFVDTLQMYFDGDDNSAGDVQTLIGTIKTLRQLECGTVIMHHNRKADDEMRGSTALFASPDIRISAKATVSSGRYMNGSVESKKVKDGGLWPIKHFERLEFFMSNKDYEIPVLSCVDSTSFGKEAEIARFLQEHEPYTKGRTEVYDAVKGSPNKLKKVVDVMIEAESIQVGNNGKLAYVVQSEEVESI